MISADFEEKRRAMVVSQLRTSGVSEGWIVSAMGTTPRESFVPADRATTVYMDRAVPLGGGRFLNPPLATGLMLVAATPEPSDNVLLVGAGTGYVAALLAARVQSVTAIEQDAVLAAQAATNLKAASNVSVATGPLADGWSDNAPYSLIFIDGAIEELPQAIVEQLADGGRVVTGVSDGAVTRLAAGYRHSGQVALRAFADSEIAALQGFARAKEFVF